MAYLLSQFNRKHRIIILYNELIDSFFNREKNFCSIIEKIKYISSKL